ncbi:hypothetical protein D3C77_659920 [compost metagenome]
MVVSWSAFCRSSLGGGLPEETPARTAKNGSWLPLQEPKVVLVCVVGGDCTQVGQPGIKEPGAQSDGALVCFDFSQ